MNARANSRRLTRRQAGMTLIEVLVALLIFSLGMLGMVGENSRSRVFEIVWSIAMKVAEWAGAPPLGKSREIESVAVG